MLIVTVPDVGETIPQIILISVDFPAPLGPSRAKILPFSIFIIDIMDPNIWGPNMWFSLHSNTFAYPFKPTEEQAEKMAIFFNNLEYVIPCKICRINYRTRLFLDG